MDCNRVFLMDLFNINGAVDYTWSTVFRNCNQKMAEKKTQPGVGLCFFTIIILQLLINFQTGLFLFRAWYVFYTQQNEDLLKFRNIYWGCCLKEQTVARLLCANRICPPHRLKCNPAAEPPSSGRRFPSELPPECFCRVWLQKTFNRKICFEWLFCSHMVHLLVKMSFFFFIPFSVKTAQVTFRCICLS